MPFGENLSLIGGYISALESLGNVITGTEIKFMRFEEVAFHFYKDPNDPRLTYLIVSDLKEDPSDMVLKIKEIAKAFFNEYSDILDAFSGVVGPFKPFSNTLNEMNITS